MKQDFSTYIFIFHLIYTSSSIFLVRLSKKRFNLIGSTGGVSRMINKNQIFTQKRRRGRPPKSLNVENTDTQIFQSNPSKRKRLCSISWDVSGK
ncbi:hypothetical protein BpHYR1_020523 [Brachionus plicatilis]|uniref:Uncharacterized protein n=1 Tax=Brachionus plicatilis TaxID=10195 RepID=A0A3M7RM48_BRAPC|nr:hypothetical protein BpHYR1_020523 [Brachionus plicatilis]